MNLLENFIFEGGYVMNNFAQTRRGAKFFDCDFPAMVKAANRLAEAIEESNRLKKEELEMQKQKDTKQN